MSAGCDLAYRIDMLQTSRKKYLRDQLSDAYDAYLAILRTVDTRVQTALNRGGDWQSQNICPPCFYKTVGEPTLKYSYLVCFDGNNSLKLVDATFKTGTPRSDDRKSSSFRWLSPEQVNRFQDEVKKPNKPVRELAVFLFIFKANLSVLQGDYYNHTRSSTCTPVRIRGNTI